MDDLLDAAMQALLDLMRTGAAPDLPADLAANPEFERLRAYLAGLQDFTRSVAAGNRPAGLEQQGLMADGLKAVYGELRRCEAELAVAHASLRERIAEHERADEALRAGERQFREVSARAQRQAQELALMDRVRTAMASELDFAGLIRIAVEAVSATFGYDMVSLYLLEGDELVLQHQVGYDKVLARIPIHRGICGRVARTAEPVLLTDVHRDESFLEAVKGIRSEVCVPLFDEGRVVGVLNVESRGDASLGEQDLRLLVALSEQINIAIGRARLYTAVCESEARYRLLAENASDVICTIEADGRITYMSPAVTRLLGYTPEEAMALGMEGTLAPDSLRRVRQELSRARDYSPRGNRLAIGPVELQHRRKDGTTIWTESVVSPVEDEAGGLVQILSVTRDISRRKRAEERRATLSRAAQEISASIDRDQICTAIHRAAAQVMPVDAVVIALLVNEGREIEDIYLFDVGRTWPCARSPIGRGLASYVLTTGQALCVDDLDAVDAELNIGTETFGAAYEGALAVVAVPMQLRGKAIGVLSVQAYAPQRYTPEDVEMVEMLAAFGAGALENARLFDETRRRAEHLDLLNRIGTSITSGLDLEQVLLNLYDQCRAAVDIHTFSVALYDAPTGLIHFPLVREANMPLTFESQDISTQPGLTGGVIRAAKTLYLPDLDDPNDSVARQKLRSGGPPTRSYVGVPLTLRSEVIGVLAMQSLRVDAYTPEQINLLEAIATQAAISIENARLYAEARRAQEAAEEARAAAEAANRAKSVFLANMSHEVRTPLNAILGFTELMTRDPHLAVEQRNNLEIVGRSGEHLLALINDVLEMSKIEAGRTELQPESFDLRRLLQGLEEMFRLRAEGKGLRLIVECAPGVPRYVHADQGKLRQVLINLLGNAVKFTPEGGVTLRVRERTPGPVFSGLICEVEDTGIGIAPEDAEAIFDAFVQTSSGVKSQEGTGLGLAISRQFVRLMGGELTVSSELGRGSLFTAEVPCAPVDPAEIPYLERESRGRAIGLVPGQRAPGGDRYRLLVVEDDDDSRRLMVELLRALAGPDPIFEIREALNGQEAVEVWERWRPHLIWMDIRMPVMDGYEATRRIKQQAQAAGAETFVIALTASAFEEERERTLRTPEGCDDFVRKPFREDEICRALSRCLGLQVAGPEPGGEPGPSGTGATDLALQIRLLHPDWRAEMRRAATQGDLEWMAALVEQVRSTNPGLAAELTRMIDTFEHRELLRLVRGD